MKKIILASKSKARADLLRQVGLKFSVAESNVREVMASRHGYDKLVIGNARSKAMDVASRYTSGVVIAADTIVVVGKKVIGKPKNMKDAYNILKLLSRRTQSVYSGIAVYDIETGRLFTDHETTKISLLPLSDDEIRGYFKRVSPLDKAGAFDIQGLGGLFIDRIEGCYYNVVGLPLAKLFVLLKKSGVNIF